MTRTCPTLCNRVYAYPFLAHEGAAHHNLIKLTAIDTQFLIIKLLSPENDMTELEEDFELINAHLKEAANAIKNASRLSKKIGLNGALIFTQYFADDLEEDLEEEMEEKFDKIDVSLLESALEDAGWSTSSSYC